MNRSKKSILLTFLFIFSLSQIAATLVVGTNAEFPPFSYIQNNSIVGFDIDVAKEVAKRLDQTIEWRDMPFEALIPETILGRVDFVAAGMSYTDERAKRVLFSRPYLTEDPLVILSNSDKVLCLGDLKGKTVVVIEGFTADLWVSSKSGLNLIRLPTQADGFMAIKSGRVDAFVTAKSTADLFFEQQNNSSLHAVAIEGTGETCALVIPKSKPAMLLDVQKALDEMESDKTLEHLKDKWGLR